MNTNRVRLLLGGRWVLCAAGLFWTTQVPSARAATTYNFDVNSNTAGFGITTGSTYDWDDNTNGGFWSNNSVSATGNIATGAWVQDQFPKFQPAGTPTYTVTISNIESVAGMFFSTPQTVTLNPVGAGSLSIVSGLQGVLGSGSADVTFNVPITGPGEIQPSNGGNLRFNAVNTYTGGTNLSSTATLVHFNNSSSFGTNFINMGVAGLAPLLASGGATVTLPNNFTSSVNGAGVNFAADVNTPVVSTGTWTLGANNLVLRNNGGASSPLTLSGGMSGSGTATLSTNNNGLITFSGANTNTGTTAITGPGGTGTGTTKVTLKLGAANTIASSSNVTLAGGVLDPGGFTHTMGSTLLTLSASTAGSTVDYEAGPGELDFANSSFVNWTGTVLNLANWNPSADALRFGTDATGLTTGQLATIEFNGAGLGTAQLDSNGYVVVVPEPSSFLLLGAGAAGFGWSRRRRRARP